MLGDALGRFKYTALIAFHAEEEIAALEEELAGSGIPDTLRAYNLTWHDWLNLDSLMSVSRVIGETALARQDSRGAVRRSHSP